MEGTVSQVLDAIAEPSTESAQLQKQWERQYSDSPELFLNGAQELIFGVIAPALHGDEDKIQECRDNPQLVNEITAYLAFVCKKTEQASMTKGRGRVGSSPS